LARAFPRAGRGRIGERRAPARAQIIGARLTQRIVTMTTRQRTNTAHWSTRTMAAAVGISEAASGVPTV
jgi:hypothetical protein